MKKLFILTPAFIIFLSSAIGENNPKNIIGFWLSEKKDGKVEFYQSGDKYFGRLVWASNLVDAKGNPRKDALNPDEKMKGRPLLNAVIFTDFIYKNGQWEDGKIYDPTSGKTYSAILKVENNNLVIRGYIGIPLLGKTKVWERIR
jgi:uncharacterized protein (DUF2147 family)